MIYFLLLTADEASVCLVRGMVLGVLAADKFAVSVAGVL